MKITLTISLGTFCKPHQSHDSSNRSEDLPPLRWFILESSDLVFLPSLVLLLWPVIGSIFLSVVVSGI